MPKVGNKHFSYTAKGYAAAKKEARRTGKRMVVGKKQRKATRKRR